MGYNQKTTVIIPGYNCAMTIASTVESIILSGLTELEIIIVDDGSTDDSGAVCDAYAQRDNRIRVIHQKNGGLSAARNAGLDIARGEWIGFVDSDDYIAPEMYEKLYRAVQQTGADLALCDYAKVDEAGVPCVQTHVAVPQKSLTGRELLQKAYWTTVQIAWNKLYRRDIFAQLRYPVGKLNEDFFVIPEICLNTQKAVVVPDVLYYYVQRGDSIMGKRRTLRYYDAAEAAQRYWNCLVENRVYETLPAGVWLAAGYVEMRRKTILA